MSEEKNSGYSLVEIILAIAILGLVIVPVLGFMTNSSSIITYADKREMSLLIAQQRMEYLKSLGYDNLSETSGFESINTSDENYPQFNPSKYNITNIEEKIVENGDGIEIDSIYEITIKVSWDSKEIALKSKLADR